MPSQVVAGHGLPVSLTSHINSPASPVRQWLEANLPETRRLARDTNRALRGEASECLVRPTSGADPGLVGTAVDYLLRACLRVTSIESTVATRAAQQISGHPVIGLRAREVEHEAVTGIKRLRPSARDDLDCGEWARLCAYCAVLARLEQLFRAGPMNPAIFRLVIQPLGRCSGLDDFLSSSVEKATLQDLEQLGRAAFDDSRGLRRARPLVPNPTFALSRALGGADADLIAGSRLIDWKASSRRSIVGRPELWQLAGYALADTNDQFGIREVGIAALRWRTALSWDLRDFIEMLMPWQAQATMHVAGIYPVSKAGVDLDRMRQSFADLVLDAA